MVILEISTKRPRSFDLIGIDNQGIVDPIAILLYFTCTTGFFI